MKKSLLLNALTGLIFCSSVMAVSAQAAETKKKTGMSAVPVTAPSTSLSSDFSETSSVASTPGRAGFGFQTLPSRIAGSSSAISYLFESSMNYTVQAYLTVASTGPFAFGAGGIFRKTFYGNSRGGFHFGGGAATGTASAITGTGVESKFFFDLMGVVGIHFELPSLPGFMFTMDGGPQLNIFNSNTSFSLNAFSPALGLGIHYFI